MNKSIFATIGLLLVITAFSSKESSRTYSQLKSDTPTIVITNSLPNVEALDSLSETKKRLDKSISESIKVTDDLKKITKNTLKQTKIIENSISENSDTIYINIVDTFSSNELSKNKVYSDSGIIKRETQFNKFLKKLGL